MDKKHRYTFELGSIPYLRAASCYIRYEVFVLERGITREDEFDSNDRENTVYAVCFNEKQKPVSTARLLVEDENTVRITRVATLKEFRGLRLNRHIIHELESFARNRGYKMAIIHSECTAVSYYQELGYTSYTDIYIENKTECQSLKKNIEIMN